MKAAEPDVKTNYTREELKKIFENRLKTQQRHGNMNGGLYFIPSLIYSLLIRYDKELYHKKTQSKKWMNYLLNTIFFELMSGEIVPLNVVKELKLIEMKRMKMLFDKQNSQIQRRIKLSEKEVCLKAQDYNFSKKYGVYITRDGSCTLEKVFLGTEHGAVEDIDDVSLDHVTPICQVLREQSAKLNYITKIDHLIRNSNKDYRISTIEKYIEFNDQDALNGLWDELFLIIRETHGLRVCDILVN